MKAMILAAGKGTRVRPITHEIPKPMIPILHRPVMEYLVKLLKMHDFSDIMVNVSHLAKEIELYFRDGYQYGVNISYSFEGHVDEAGEHIAQAIGSAAGLKKIHDFSGFFDETFVVLCGDALIDVDLTEALKWHREKGSMATIIMKTVDPSEVSSYGVVVTDENGKVQSFQEKPTVREALSNTINTGIYIFEPEILNHIPSGKTYDIGSDLLPTLVEKNLPFYALSMEFQWVDIGRVPDYWRAVRSVLRGEVNGITIPGKEIKSGVFAGLNVSANWDKINIQGPVYIGGSTQIEDGANIIGPSVIGANCHICSNVLIENSVVFEYSRLGPGLCLVDKLVYGRYCVDQTGVSVDLSSAELDWLITDARKLPGDSLNSLISQDLVKGGF